MGATPKPTDLISLSTSAIGSVGFVCVRIGGVGSMCVLISVVVFESVVVDRFGFARVVRICARKEGGCDDDDRFLSK